MKIKKDTSGKNLEAEKKIRSMSEKEFQGLLANLLKTMQYENVEINCGPQEYGKDIFFSKPDKINKTNCACVVKVGDINQSGTSKIIEQVGLSLRMPVNTKNGKLKIHEVLVVTNGVYKQNARTIISDHEDINSSTGRVTFWDISDVVKHGLELIPSLVTSSESIELTQYKEQVLQQLNTYDNMKFLQSDFGVNTDRIEDFEIKIKTKYKSITEEKNKYLMGKVDKTPHLETLSEAEELFKNNNSYLVTGIPTSGKTSFLKRIGKKFIKLYPSNYIFYYQLHKIINGIKDSEIKDLINDSYKNITGSDLNLKLLQEEKSLLLLDGLDELLNDEQRESIIAKILIFSTEFPKCQIILTSRPIEFIETFDTLKEKFERYDLLPLNIEQFIKLGEKILGEEKALNEYVTLIKKSDIINAFPKTPLTSIVLCILFKEKKIDVQELPTNITELYKKFIDLFLNKWDSSKGISEQFKFQQKEFILQHIAKYLHDRNIMYITKDNLYKVLEDLSKTKQITELKNIPEFVTELQNSTNIFKTTTNKDVVEFSFFHLTIQEYLASVRLKSTDEDILLNNYYDDWWLNPMIFYTGKESDNSSFIEKISSLKNYPNESANKIRYIINSSMILTAAHLIDKKYRKELLISMIEIFNSFTVDILKNIALSENHPLKNKTVLDIILDARNFFLTRFKTNSFQECLKEIWREISANDESKYLDITKYCIAYTLAIKNKNEDYLIEFLDDDSLNVRWFKIIKVDIEINKLRHTKPNPKLIKKLNKKIADNLKYVNDQFKKPLKKHINSLLDIDS